MAEKTFSSFKKRKYMDADHLEKIERVGVNDLAKRLIGYFGSAFAGKDRGKFRFSRRALMALAGRRYLTDAFLQRLQGELASMGYLFLDLHCFFAQREFFLFSIAYFDGLRSLPLDSYREELQKLKDLPGKRRSRGDDGV